MRLRYLCLPCCPRYSRCIYPRLCIHWSIISEDSFIVGIVGAGGLGQKLSNAVNLFEWLDAGVIIALIIVLVNLADYFSYRVRRVFS